MAILPCIEPRISMEWSERMNTQNALPRGPQMKVLLCSASAVMTSRCCPSVILLLLKAQIGMYSGCLGVEIGLPLYLLDDVKL